ncbi:hypothetical protein F7P08_00505 [Klebsiella pneumoniae]|nr:hypothetical protein F7P08_00505 [Klebsiella pneumoniae]
MTDTNFPVSMPSTPFSAPRAFKSVANGKIYIGTPDTDPVNPANQIPVYVVNEDGSEIQVSQPIIINAGGFPAYNGQIMKFITKQNFSMAVYDAYGAQQYYWPDLSMVDPGSALAGLSSHDKGLGASLIGLEGQGTVQDALFFMTPMIAAADPAVGVSDVYAKFGTAMNAAISKAQKQGCGLIFVPGGRYTLDVTIAATLSRSLTILFSADAYI